MTCRSAEPVLVSTCEVCKCGGFSGLPILIAIFSQNHFIFYDSGHTIWKFKKTVGQNTFKILLLNNVKMLGEH